MLALVASPHSPEHVELREVPEPEPGPQEALVEVRAISVNRGEVTRLASAHDGQRFGWDFAGIVARAAEDGSSPPPGSRVVGFVLGGAWAQLVAVEGTRLAELPDDVSWAAASALPVAGLTALRTLRLGGPLLGTWVLVTGAAGGVGRFAVQLASLSGARVTALVGSPERGEGLRDLGANDVVIDPADAGGPFHLILESAGGSSLATALGMVAPRGTVVTFGNSARAETTINIGTFYPRAARLVGFSLLQPWEQQGLGEDLGSLLALLSIGKLDPHVTLERSWREAAEVMRALHGRRVQGKAVLHVH